MRACEFDLLRRRVNTRNSSGRKAINDCFCEYAASAANVEPTQIRGQVQPVQEFVRQQTAPASHPLVVGCARSPFVHSRAQSFARLYGACVYAGLVNPGASTA